MKKLSFILLCFIFKTSMGFSLPQEYSIVEKENRKGLRDFSGKIIIPAVYENLGWSDGSFSVKNGRIGYQESGLWGIINLENKRITSPGYVSLIPVNDNILIGSVPDQYKLSELLGLINYDGKALSGFHYNYLKRSGNLFIGGIRKFYDMLYGVIDEKGEVIIPVKYVNISPLHNDLFSANNEMEISLIYNAMGEILSTLEVDEISPFIFGYAGIKHQGKKGLIDKSGKIILEPEFKEVDVKSCSTVNYLKFKEWKILDTGENSKFLFYDSLRPVSGEKYLAYSGSNVNLVDAQGISCASFPDLHIIQILRDYIIVKLKNKYGLLSLGGTQIYPLQYDSILCMYDYVLLKKKNDSENGWLLGNNQGEILNYGLYEQLIPNSNFNILAKRKGYWGILNNYGMEVINCIYDSIDLSDDGLIRVVFHGEEGVLWKYHWLVYPGKYHVKIIPDHRVLINSYRGNLVLNVLGDTVFKSDNFLIPEEKYLLIRNSSGKTGLLDPKFNTILGADYSVVKSFNNDSLFVFRNADGWGCIKYDGKILFKNLTNIDSIISFSEGYFSVSIDDFMGFIDLGGKLSIANRYQDAGDFVDGIAPVKLLNHWGFINRLEQIVVQPFYDKVNYLGDHLILVQKDEKYGMINDSGVTIQDIEYDLLKPIPGCGYLCVKENLLGFVDKKGNLTVTPHYDFIRNMERGKMIVMRNNKYGVLSDSGEKIIPLVYDELFENPFNHSIIGSINSEWQNFVPAF
jgi:hypothetical protein